MHDAGADGDESDEDELDVTDAYEQYKYYNLTLRAWFIGFGIGLPALLLSQEHLYDKLKGHEEVGRNLAIAVGLQIGGAVLNKYTNWATASSSEAGYADVLRWIQKRMWLDILIDVVSTALLIGVALRVASILL